MWCRCVVVQVHEAIREDPSPAPKKAFKPDKKYKKKTKDSKVRSRAQSREVQGPAPVSHGGVCVLFSVWPDG